MQRHKIAKSNLFLCFWRLDAECPTLSAPAHSFKATKLNGAIVMFFCEPGYTLVGNSEIYCDGRQWNASTPFCRGTGIKINFVSLQLLFFYSQSLFTFLLKF